jgi:transposase
MFKDGAMPRTSEVEVFAVQRGRERSAEEKQSLVEATFQPGLNVSLVARQHGIAPSLLFCWRKFSRQPLVLVNA